MRTGFLIRGFGPYDVAGTTFYRTSLTFTAALLAEGIFPVTAHTWVSIHHHQLLVRGNLQDGTTDETAIPRPAPILCVAGQFERYRRRRHLGGHDQSDR